MNNNLLVTAEKPLETEMSKLQKQNQQLQQENKVLQLRAAGVQMLGKVLQNSQDESEQLKTQVEHLQATLRKAGIEDPSLSSYCTEQTTSSHKSGMSSSNSSFFPPLSSNQYTSLMQSVDPFSSSLPNKEFQLLYSLNGPLSLNHHPEIQTKELHHKFRNIKEELDKLYETAHKMMEKMKSLDSDEGKGELVVKLGRLRSRIQNAEKEAKTREALTGALMSQEVDLKAKWAEVEAEQISQEHMAQQLFRNIEEDKEELERLQDEISFYQDTIQSKNQQLTEGVVANTSASSNKVLEKTEETGESTILKEIPVTTNHGIGKEEFQLQLEKLQLENTELQGIIQTLRNERDEAIKQNEEIRDVNQLWDTQYRQLQSETNKEIFELKQKIELLTCDDSQKRFDKLWMKSKENVDIERKAKEKAQEEKQIYQGRCASLEEELKILKEEKKELLSLLEKKEKHVSLLQENLCRSPSPTLTAHPGTITNETLPLQRVDTETQKGNSRSSNLHEAALPSFHAPPEIVDQIEMLKTQLRMYYDDFQNERGDRERAQAEKHKVEEELKATKEQIIALETQMEQYYNDWKKEKDEKDHLQKRLQKSGSGAQAPEDIQYPNQARLTRDAQAIAEKQARLQCLREQDMQERMLEEQRQNMERRSRGLWPEYRGQNNYPLYLSGRISEYSTHEPQRYLYARGPMQPSLDRGRSYDDVFKGGDVQPDSDPGYEVIDGISRDKGGKEQNKDKESVSQKESLIQCPRCLRNFDEYELLTKHTDKCIS